MQWIKVNRQWNKWLFPNGVAKLFKLHIIFMSAIQFLRCNKSAGWKAGLALLLILGSYAFYSFLLSPTRIALVNFPSYKVSNIVLSTDSRLIQVDEVTAEQASSLKNYDAILLFGPGLRLTNEQINNIESRKERNYRLHVRVHIRANRQPACRQPATKTTRHLLQQPQQVEFPQYAILYT